MKLFLIAFGLFLSSAIILANCTASSNRRSQATQYEITETAVQTEKPLPSRAELVTMALAAAYPGRIEKAEFRNGDWAVLLDDTWFYYAEGRLLPEELRERVSEYSPVFIYSYQRELLPWTPLSPEQINRPRSSGNEQPIRRSRPTYFFDAIYQARNRAEAYERVETIQFLGHQVTIHYLIREIIAQIENEIKTASETEPQVRSWINEINIVDGWSWRNVSGSQSRSYHSYGVAIDILPRSTGGRAMYWQWVSNWWNIPYEGRYHPPDTVIEIFESYGFYWGGRWLHFFDTMHFEYRPEVFILSGFELVPLP